MRLCPAVCSSILVGETRGILGCLLVRRLRRGAARRRGSCLSFGALLRSAMR